MIKSRRKVGVVVTQRRQPNQAMVNVITRGGTEVAPPVLDREPEEVARGATVVRERASDEIDRKALIEKMVSWEAAKIPKARTSGRRSCRKSTRGRRRIRRREMNMKVACF